MKKGVPFKKKKIELFNREFNYLQDIVMNGPIEKLRYQDKILI